VRPEWQAGQPGGGAGAGGRGQGATKQGGNPAIPGQGGPQSMQR